MCAGCRRAKRNDELLAVPGVVEAKSHSKWPLRGLTSGTPDPNRLACLGIRGEGGAQHADEHTKPLPGLQTIDMLAQDQGACKVPQIYTMKLEFCTSHIPDGTSLLQETCCQGFG